MHFYIFTFPLIIMFSRLLWRLCRSLNCLCIIIVRVFLFLFCFFCQAGLGLDPVLLLCSWMTLDEPHSFHLQKRDNMRSKWENVSYNYLLSRYIPKRTIFLLSLSCIKIPLNHSIILEPSNLDKHRILFCHKWICFYPYIPYLYLLVCIQHRMFQKDIISSSHNYYYDQFNQSLIGDQDLT